jgi:aspartyl-tRNA(Asn)/glutamyl-tRNA(Gln) amidotransferase subunit A
MTTLHQLGVAEAIQALHSGQVCSVELTRACLQRIDQFESELHAFITLIPERALELAEAADKKLSQLRQAEEAIPALLGLPIVVKDVLCLAGVRCTCGSKILENFVPSYNATSVQRLMDAGVIPLGKTNMDEFAMGSSTENSAYGPTHNPWDTSRVPGGSSGGSAAVVAARLAPAAVGSDTGGSVRQPASFCGVTGLKPTYGRVSRYGLVAYGSSLDCVGCFARSAKDVEILFRLMAGYDELDATTIAEPIPRSVCMGEADLKGLKLGIPREYFISGVQPEVELTVRKAIAELGRLGAEVCEVNLPHTQYALPVYYLISPSEASANLARYDGVRYGSRESNDSLRELYFETRGSRFGAEVKRRIMLGTYALSSGYYDAYYGQAQKVRTLIKGDFDAAFEKVDAIAAPVAPTTAFKLGEHSADPLDMYLEDVFTLPANLSGVPGLAFPVGFDEQHLPIGMQLMAAPFREDVLLKLAYAYQQVSDWHTQEPPLGARDDIK